VLLKKNEERYRFNEDVQKDKKPKLVSNKSTVVSLKTKQDLDSISKATRVSASGLRNQNNASFKSVTALSHFSRKSGKTRTVTASRKALNKS
jgi:hypothetical protein